MPGCITGGDDDVGNGIATLIKSRRSIRAFTLQAVPEYILRELVEAGTWAPSGSNVQAWRFVIVTDVGKIEAISAFSPGLQGGPPAVIVLCTDRKIAFEKAGSLGRDELCTMDISMAAQNILLLATEKGLGTCPVHSFNKNALSRILKLPEHIWPDLIISIGYADESPVPPTRQALDHVCFFNEWGGCDDA